MLPHSGDSSIGMAGDLCLHRRRTAAAPGRQACIGLASCVLSHDGLRLHDRPDRGGRPGCHDGVALIHILAAGWIAEPEPVGASAQLHHKLQLFLPPLVRPAEPPRLAVTA